MYTLCLIFCLCSSVLLGKNDNYDQPSASDVVTQYIFQLVSPKSLLVDTIVFLCITVYIKLMKVLQNTFNKSECLLMQELAYSVLIVAFSQELHTDFNQEVF